MLRRPRTRPALAFAAVALGLSLLPARPASAQGEPPPAHDLARARELDQQGVRAFREGHYRDAIKLFTEAYHLGGPSSEIWNIARCHQKLDEPEQADAEFERYLGQSDLTPEDRAQATKELDELKKSPSMLSVDSDPPGATVLVDGKKPASGTGVTPTAVEVPPGKHAVRVEKSGVGAYDQEVEARYGRAILVQAKLRGAGAGGANVGAGAPAGSGANGESGAGGSEGADHGGNGRGGSDADADRGASARINGPSTLHHVSVSLEIGYFVPKLGDDSQGLRPTANVAGRYAFVDKEAWLATLGVRVGFTPYGGSGPDPAPMCQLSPDYGATDLGVLAVVGAAARLGRFRVGGDLGFGLAALLGGGDGPDANNGNCGGYGVKGLGHLGTEVSYALSSRLRVLLSPVTFEAHPGYDGARTAPVDATGLWWRIGSTIGAAFEL